MATKSQLKQYFETGKIPTQAQFGELIDSIPNLIGGGEISSANSEEVRVINLISNILYFVVAIDSEVYNIITLLIFVSNGDNSHVIEAYTNNADQPSTYYICANGQCDSNSINNILRATKFNDIQRELVGLVSRKYLSEIRQIN